MRTSFLALALSISLSAGAAETPFWGDTQSLPTNTPIAQIGDGQFIWEPAASASGPIAVVVSLSEQRVYAYRNGVIIGISSASTGKDGHETPTGVFVTLQKDKDHKSSLYNSAPMPYTQRLTWDGIALHAGGLPGYPSSHGCVHLPSEFARLLFEAAPMGMTVVIADENSAPQSVAHPRLLLPVDAETGDLRQFAELGDSETQRWTPEASPEGPLSIVVSGRDRLAVVLRNGVEIGRTRVEISDPETPLGTQVYVAGQRDPADKVPWYAIGVIGHESATSSRSDVSSVNRIRAPRDFTRQVVPLIEAGTALLVTDGTLSSDTIGVEVQVVDSDPPQKDGSS